MEVNSPIQRKSNAGTTLYPAMDYADGLRRTSIYYCDAGCPYQKGAIEVNHELIRRVLPKGSSFDNLTQEDVTRMMGDL